LPAPVENHFQAFASLAVLHAFMPYETLHVASVITLKSYALA